MPTDDATSSQTTSKVGAVWGGMDQATLDAAYDQTVYAPNRRQILDRFAASSERVRQRLGAPLRFAYGSGEREGMDVYPAASSTPAPVQIFIHGGAWRSGLAERYGFPAETFVRAGAHFVVPDFDWVQDHDGDLMPIADQIRRAIAWVWHNADSFGGDRNRIHLSGHSSGAHMAAVALTTDWPVAFDVPADVIKSALLCSGMYEMRPVRLSARSTYVTFSDESEAALSPMRHLETVAPPLVVAYGTLETPEFKRQSADFADAMTARGHPVRLLIAEHCNHFEILETLANPYGLLGTAALDQMTVNRMEPEVAGSARR